MSLTSDVPSSLLVAQSWTQNPTLLHANLPKIATWLFGSNTPGIINSQFLDQAQIVNFAGAHGILFKSLLQLDGWYELGLERFQGNILEFFLPRIQNNQLRVNAVEYWLLRLLMVVGQNVQPASYVNPMLSSGALNTLGTSMTGNIGNTLGSSVQPALTTQSSLFSFMRPTQPIPGQSSPPLQPTQGLLSRLPTNTGFFGSTSQPTYLPPSYVNPVYQSILQSYLDWFLPSLSHPPSLSSATRFKSSFLIRGASRTFDRLPDRVGPPPAIPEFFINGIMQLWCNQSLVDANMVTASSSLVPTQSVISSLDTVTSHLAKQEEEFPKKAHSQILSKMYPLVKLGMQKGGLDVVKATIDLWIHVMSPWSLNNVAFDDSFKPYIVQNYLYYSVLVKTWLDRLKDDVVGFSSEMDKTFMFLVKTPRLVHTLSEVEASLLMHDGMDPSQQVPLALQGELTTYSPVWNMDAVPVSRQETMRIARTLRANITQALARRDALPSTATLEKSLSALDDLFPTKTMVEAIPTPQRPAAPESEGGSKSWMSPNVLLPETRPDGTLTPRGKYQVRHGLAKMAPNDVVARPGKKNPAVIHDYEIPILVHLLQAIAGFLEWTMHKLVVFLANRYPQALPWDKIHSHVNFQWLRWFASIPNLIGLAIVLFFGMLLFGIFKWVFWIVSLPPSPVPQIRQPSRNVPPPARKVVNPWQH